jgi:hypothetical protein
MDCKRKVSKAFNNNPQGNWLTGWPNNKWWNCVQTDTNKCKIGNWKDRSKTDSLMGQSSALNWGAIKEEAKDEEEILNSMYLK